MTGWRRYVSFYSSCFCAFSSPCTNPDLWHFHKGRTQPRRNARQDTDTFATWDAGSSYSLKRKTVKYFLKKKREREKKTFFKFFALFSFCFSKIRIIRNFCKVFWKWLNCARETNQKNIYSLYRIYIRISNL